MKILMLLDNPFVSDARVHRSINALIGAGHDIVLLSMSDKQFAEKDVVNGCKVERILDEKLLQPFKPGYFSLLKEVADFVLYRYNFDLVHCNDFYLLPLVSAIRERKPKVKIVYDSHEYFRAEYSHTKVKGIWKKFKTLTVWTYLILMEKIVARNADVVISPSSPITHRLKKIFGSKPYYVTVRNIPDRESVEKTNYFRNIFRIGNDKKIVVHLGNVHVSAKAFQMVVNSLARKNELSIVFLIDDNRVSESLKEILSKKNTSNIFLHPFPKDYEMSKILSSADIGLILVRHNWLSHKLASPNRMMEYILAGVPFVSSFNLEAMELSEKYNCGEVAKVAKCPDFGSAINKVLSSHEDYILGCLKVSKELSWKKEKEKLVNAYSMITEE